MTKCIFCCDASELEFTGCQVCGRGLPPTNCPIREHTGDGHYVGRCDFGLTGKPPLQYCPRHGWTGAYKNNDDRDIPVSRRSYDPMGTPEKRKQIWSSIAGMLASDFKLKYARQAWKFSRMDDPPREWPEGHPLHNP